MFWPAVILCVIYGALLLVALRACLEARRLRAEREVRRQALLVLQNELLDVDRELKQIQQDHAALYAHVYAQGFEEGFRVAGARSMPAQLIN